MRFKYSCIEYRLFLNCLKIGLSDGALLFVSFIKGLARVDSSIKRTAAGKIQFNQTLRMVEPISQQHDEQSNANQGLLIVYSVQKKQKLVVGTGRLNLGIYNNLQDKIQVETKILFSDSLYKNTELSVKLSLHHIETPFFLSQKAHYTQSILIEDLNKPKDEPSDSFCSQKKELIEVPQKQVNFSLKIKHKSQNSVSNNQRQNKKQSAEQLRRERLRIETKREEYQQSLRQERQRFQSARKEYQHQPQNLFTKNFSVNQNQTILQKKIQIQAQLHQQEQQIFNIRIKQLEEELNKQIKKNQILQSQIQKSLQEKSQKIGQQHQSTNHYVGQIYKLQQRQSQLLQDLRMMKNQLQNPPKLIPHYQRSDMLPQVSTFQARNVQSVKISPQHSRVQQSLQKDLNKDIQIYDLNSQLATVNKQLTDKINQLNLTLQEKSQEAQRVFSQLRDANRLMIILKSELSDKNLLNAQLAFKAQQLQQRQRGNEITRWQLQKSREKCEQLQQKGMQMMRKVQQQEKIIQMQTEKLIRVSIYEQVQQVLKFQILQKQNNYQSQRKNLMDRLAELQSQLGLLRDLLSDKQHAYALLLQQTQLLQNKHSQLQQLLSHHQFNNKEADGQKKKTRVSENLLNLIKSQSANQQLLKQIELMRSQNEKLCSQKLQLQQNLRKQIEKSGKKKQNRPIFLRDESEDRMLNSLMKQKLDQITKENKNLNEKYEHLLQLNEQLQKRNKELEESIIISRAKQSVYLEQGNAQRQLLQQLQNMVESNYSDRFGRRHVEQNKEHIQLREKLVQYESIAKQLYIINIQLNSSLVARQQQSNKLLKQIQHLVQVNLILKKQLDNKNQQYRKLSDQFKSKERTMCEKMDQKQKQVQRSQAQLTSYHGAKQKQKIAQKRSSQLENQINKLNQQEQLRLKQRKQLQAQLDNMKQSLTKINKQKLHLQSTITQLTLEIGQQREQNTQATSALSTLQLKCESLTFQCQKEKTKSASLQEEIEVFMRKLKCKKSNTSYQLFQQKIKLLDKQLSIKAECIKQNIFTIQELRLQIVQLKQQISTLQLQQSLKDWQPQSPDTLKDKERQRIGLMQTENEQLLKQVSQLKKQIFAEHNQLQKHRQQIDFKQQQILGLKSMLTQQRGKSYQLQTEISRLTIGLQQALQGKSDQEVQIEKIKTTIQFQQKFIWDSKALSKQLQNQIAVLKQKLHTNVKVLKQKEEEINNMNSENNRLRNSSRTIEKRTDRKPDESSKELKSAKELQMILNGFKEQVRKKERENQLLKQKFQQERKLRLSLQEKMILSQGKVQFETNLETFLRKEQPPQAIQQQVLKNLSRQLQTVRTYNQSLKQTNSALVVENSRLKDQLQETSKKSIQDSRTISFLKKQNKDFEEDKLQREDQCRKRLLKESLQMSQSHHNQLQALKKFYQDKQKSLQSSLRALCQNNIQQVQLKQLSLEEELEKEKQSHHLASLQFSQLANRHSQLQLQFKNLKQFKQGIRQSNSQLIQNNAKLKQEVKILKRQQQISRTRENELQQARTALQRLKSQAEERSDKIQRLQSKVKQLSRPALARQPQKPIAQTVRHPLQPNAQMNEEINRLKYINQRIQTKYSAQMQQTSRLNLNLQAKQQLVLKLKCRLEQLSVQLKASNSQLQNLKKQFSFQKARVAFSEDLELQQLKIRTKANELQINSKKKQIEVLNNDLQTLKENVMSGMNHEPRLQSQLALSLWQILKIKIKA